MIENLTIENGNMNNIFSQDIYEYEVSVDSSVSSLIFSYDLSDEYNVTIYGNDELTGGENHVYLEVSDDNSVTSYIFVVDKEETEQVFNYNIKEEENLNYFYKNKELIISGISFILIVLLFVIIFKKR